MPNLNTLLNDPRFFWPLFLLVVWDGIWKAIGMWKASKNNQTGWFVAIFIFNTLGILPMIYLQFFQKKSQ